ncbi:hypothetical protein TNIN_466821 [Trichonephila inaurata madagascariensis]|uniref:Uncharacterized protein n=1 Tax=Trichonephila inaurata madagascariensis TaxID=2747483 RepID=A0A8X7BUV8_9ARAC|nr:hypothetical protein TNIN_466821 [Trichonephila inaurata madagascariensis]
MNHLLFPFFCTPKIFHQKKRRIIYQMDVTQNERIQGKDGKTPIYIYLYLLMVFYITLAGFKQSCYCSIFHVPGSFVKLFVGDQRR